LNNTLITGASGLLGSNLVRHYASISNCTGWYSSNQISIDGAILDRVDLTDHRAVETALQRTQPDLIIHCAAASDVDWCEQHPDQAKAINVDATKFMVEQSIKHGSKFIFVSSPFIFDGIAGHYRESDLPGPLNSYATGKVIAEEYVTDIDSNSLIVRACFFGHSPAGNHSLLEWVLGTAANAVEVPGFTDSYFSPISVLDFADALDAAIADDTSGILHLGSSNAVSKYEFARMVLATYGFDAKLLSPITVAEADLNANRPRNTSLDVSLLQKIWKKTAPTVTRGIERFADQPNPFS
jgi:dTDP-4-dehydrorhamnose reductase